MAAQNSVSVLEKMLETKALQSEGFQDKKKCKKNVFLYFKKNLPVAHHLCETVTKCQAHTFQSQPNIFAKFSFLSDLFKNYFQSCFLNYQIMSNVRLTYFKVNQTFFTIFSFLSESEQRKSFSGALGFSLGSPPLKKSCFQADWNSYLIGFLYYEEETHFTNVILFCTFPSSKEQQQWVTARKKRNICDKYFGFIFCEEVQGVGCKVGGC